MQNSLQTEWRSWRYGTSLLAMGCVLLVSGPAFALPAQDNALPRGQNAEILMPVQTGNDHSGGTLKMPGRDLALIIAARDGPSLLGDVNVTLTDNGMLHVSVQRILDLLAGPLAPGKLTAVQKRLAGRATITLEDFADTGIALRFDPQTLELRFSIPSDMRAAQVVQVSAVDPVQIGAFQQPARASGYVNIRGALDYLGDGPVTGLQSPNFYIDGAFRLGRIVAESEAFWQPGISGRDLQRQGSRLVYDDLKHVIRFTLGDLQPVARSMQVAPSIAGISMARAFNTLQPERIIRPRGSRSFLLERPSLVEVYVNDTLVRRLQLPAGNYNLNDFPFIQGANNIKVIITDESGRHEMVRFNMFLNQSQLAKDLTEFGIYAGVEAPMSQSALHYSNNPIFSGFVRRGMSENLTLGANFQADAHSQMGGFEAIVATPIGAFLTTASTSRMDGFGTGWAATAAYQGLFRRPRGLADALNIMVERRSKNFASVAMVQPNNPFRYELSGSYAHPLNARAYIAVDGRFSKGRAGVVDQHYYRLSGGLRLTDRLSLTAETRYEHNAFRAEVSGLISLNIRLSRASSLQTGYESVDHRRRLTYQTLSGQGTGAYSLSGDVEQNDRGGDLNLNANYGGNLGDLGLSHIGVFSRNFQHSQSQRTTLRGATSIAFADGSFAIGRPIYDSFAIIKPHSSFGGKTLRIDPFGKGSAAKTSALGPALYPSLNAYSERTITVEIPDDADMADPGRRSFRVLPAYRSGYLLRVGSSYNLTALGILVGTDGQPISLATGKVHELGKSDPVSYEIFTNRDGRVAMTGLSPGHWRIEMADEDHTQIDIEIPERPEAGLIKLGTIRQKDVQ